MLVLSERDVRDLLDLDLLVEALSAAMADLSAGLASMPPRGAAFVPQRRAMLAAMPAYLPSSRALTAKLVSQFPENHHCPAHQAIICCFDPDSGTPRAVMDGAYITAARTAAGSVLATRLLARVGSRAVAVIGTGAQARAHITAFARQPGVEVVRIAGRNWAKVETLAAELRSDGLLIEAARSIQEAVESADVVCATTHADQPVIAREWVRPGSHINSVGYNRDGRGELEAALIADALVVVESRQAALAPPPSGALELRQAIHEGLITADHIHAEIGELVSGNAKGRTDDTQLTVYKSVGVAVQDAAAAALVLAEAERRGAGTSVTI
ncbi:MAG: ornithine cyclodeaminase family protein [Chloroflexota bacterium]|nr:ornithine cyclodeaminase family protein [Chloroflexota bacterium]